MTAAAVESDQVEQLIETEKNTETAWTQDRSELPAVGVPGNVTGAEIFSVASVPNLLCDSVDLDSLAEGGQVGVDGTINLNTALQQTREEISNDCLVQPGDRFMAVAAGTQTAVVIDSFFLRSIHPVCPTDPPYALWVRFQSTAPVVPLFFSTDPELHEGSNSLPGIKGPTTPPADLMKALKSQVRFLDEYAVESFEVGTPNCQRVAVLRRTKVELDDTGSINEAVFAQTGTGVTLLRSELVNSGAGSGHVRLGAVLDFNGDGLADLVLDGDEEGCAYQAIFRGQSGGFRPEPMPTQRCRCIENR
jgi:hypothetical protein